MKNVYTTLALAALLSACSGGSSTTAPVANEGPKIATVSDQTIEANTSSDPIALRISDDTTPAIALGVEIASNNGILLPPGSLTTSATAEGRALTITPEPGVIGVATITVTVTDAQGAAQSRSFDLTVNRQQMSFDHLVRSVYPQAAEEAPRELDSLIITQDDANEDFSDLL